MEKSFDQVNALISRLMEGVGGSANAYEDAEAKSDSNPHPAADGVRLEDLPPPRTVGIGLGVFAAAVTGLPPRVAPVPEQPDDPGPIDVLDTSPPPEIEDGVLGDDGCAEGVDLDWASLEGPEPISDLYHCVGIVEESDELKAVYFGIEEANRTGLLQPVAMDTGLYNLEKGWGTPPSFKVNDLGKEREYILEASHIGELEDVPEKHLFIWVLDSRARDGEALGYIQNGWVFLRK